MGQSSKEIAKVFIAHSTSDRKLAEGLRQDLRRHHLEVFLSDTAPGQLLTPDIETNIQESDFFLVILSASAKRSSWVQRELGLAIELREQRGAGQPTILGVRCSRRTYVLETKHFRSEQRTGFYDFSKYRCLNYEGSPDPDPIDQFIKRHLCPKLVHYSGPDTADVIPQTVFDLYEKLFPDAALRNRPQEIQSWIDEARNLEMTSPWREIFSALHLGERTIGLAYASGHTEEQFVFWNYFGIAQGYRNGQRPETFLKDFRMRILEFVPKARFSLFEIEPPNIRYLQDVAARPAPIPSYDDREKAYAHIRTVRRLNLFQRWADAAAFADSDGRPIPYWQPAMELPLSEENERELILMAHPFDGFDVEEIDFGNALNFIYEKVYLESVEGDTEIDPEVYSDYVSSVKNRVLERSQNCRFRRVSVPGKVWDLLSKARVQGFLDRIAL